jgi:hypothetical protein
MPLLDPAQPVAEAIGKGLRALSQCCFRLTSGGVVAESFCQQRAGYKDVPIRQLKAVIGGGVGMPGATCVVTCRPVRIALPLTAG